MSKVQSVLFDRLLWRPNRARQWLLDNNFKRLKRVDITKNFLRYRIRSPLEFNRFRIIKKKNGIKFVIGFEI